VPEKIKVVVIDIDINTDHPNSYLGVSNTWEILPRQKYEVIKVHSENSFGSVKAKFSLHLPKYSGGHDSLGF